MNLSLSETTDKYEKQENLGGGSSSRSRSVKASVHPSGNKVQITHFWKGTFKNYVTRKITYWLPLPHMSHLIIFFSQITLPLVSFTTNWQTKVWHEDFLRIDDCLNILYYIQGDKKRFKISYNLCRQLVIVIVIL